MMYFLSPGKVEAPKKENEGKLKNEITCLLLEGYCTHVRLALRV